MHNAALAAKVAPPLKKAGPPMVITLSSSALEAQVSPLGAELVGLRDEEKRDLLWDGNPAFWSGRSPLLFPIVGRLSADRARIDGVEYSLKQHGFARHSQFEVIDASASTCRLRLGASAATREQYPFDFVLDVTYRLEGDRLILSASVLNAGQRAMPVSFGFHPAFRWPLPYGGTRDDHEIRFESPETEPVRRLSDGLLGSARHRAPVEGDRLPLRDDLFYDGALVFDRLTSRIVRYGAPGRRSITVAFPDLPHLGIWTKPNAGFVCIEPWQGYASPEGFDGELAEKPGMVLIPSGGARRFEMTISVTPPDEGGRGGHP